MILTSLLSFLWKNLFTVVVILCPICTTVFQGNHFSSVLQILVVLFFLNCSAVNSCPASPNGAGNVPVFTRKAVGRDHKYSYISNMPEGLSVKDSRIPVPLGVGGKSKEKEVTLLI